MPLWWWNFEFLMAPFGFHFLQMDRVMGHVLVETKSVMDPTKTRKLKHLVYFILE
jgi:hypothetical protein